MNRYFQEDVERLRQTLGIPKGGFSQAVNEFKRGIKRGAYDVPLGNPDLPKLRKRAKRLGLPLGARIEV